MSDELKLSRQHVRELEGYIGGDIPDLPVEDGRSVTWVEEREHLHTTIRVSQNYFSDEKCVYQ